MSKIGMIVLAAGLLVSAQAQQAESGWYFRGDLGASLLLATDLEEFLGSTDDVEVEFDPGFHVGIVGGYRITPWLAVEMESGVVFNSIDEVDGESLDASLFQAPFMGNVVVQCNNLNRWVPFLGAGVGGVSSILDIDERFDYGEGGYVRVEGSDSDFVFAYQAFAGVRYEFNDRMGIGVIYRFMGTQGPSWDVDDDGFGSDWAISLDDVFTHSLSVLFQLQF